jgi:hypothetical protein
MYMSLLPPGTSPLMSGSRHDRPVPAYGLDLAGRDIKVGDQVLGLGPRGDLGIARTVSRIVRLRPRRHRRIELHFADGYPPRHP